MKRIALFGGSFDPVHHGHLLVARAACEELGVSRVIFIPASQSPFKPDRLMAAPEHRLAMLRLSLAGWTNAEVDDREVRRGGVSYTVDTVRELLAANPGSELVCLIGADHVPTLPSWRDAHALADLASFAAVPRPGQTPAPGPSPFRVTWLHGVPFGVSSSNIRERLRVGSSVDLLMDPAAADYARRNRLYL